ncbi:MAG: adenine deaminase [Planctomycetota bacterium]
MPADPELIAVARGDAPADLVLSNARVINVFTRDIEDNVNVVIKNGAIARIGDDTDAAHRIDVGGSYVGPGFIDAHMHVESTMMRPSEFVRLALPHGTTGVVFDPHEIANVCGIPGMRFLMDDARDLPMRIMFAASSCVPASHLETAGAALSADDLAPLFDDDRVVALAEMMNFPGVVHAFPDVLEKVRLGLEHRIVDGHCPGLRGDELQAYIAAGISSDHECTTADEAREKLRRGMQVYLREGSAARNIEALVSVVTAENAHRCCFCTDDRHPGDLRDEGHIDHAVRRAIACGLDPVTAIAMGSRHTAQHYNQRELGAVAPGMRADLVVFDDARAPSPRQVFVDGVLVAEDGVMTAPPRAADRAPDDAHLRNTVHLPDDFGAHRFRIESSNPTANIRVIGMNPHSLVTEHLVMPATRRDGELVTDPDRDLLKLAVIERHGKGGSIGLGFVTGFGFRDGALASTVGHDSHNLTVVGSNDIDMEKAARVLTKYGGGQCVVRGGKVLACLPLPLAGLLSDESAEALVEQQQQVLEKVRELGCPHHDPFMPLSFLPLSVIPTLKLSDQGLVDVNRFRIVTVETTED